MPEMNVCESCGVPLFVSSQHEWRNNGVILASRETRHRLAFFECGNLDPLFRGIEEILGIPIQHIILDTARRSTRSYMERVVADDLIDLIRSGGIDLKLVIDSTFLIWRAMGYGKLSLVNVRYEHDSGDFITVLAERPYSVPLSVGNFAGAIEALVGYEPGIDYEETRPGVFKITIVEAENPAELKERLRWKDYDREYKEGDNEFERCPGCGAPAALGECTWDQANGSIRSTVTGRRMVMAGPSMIDPIFDELEAELGDTIPRVVVEAQKRFIRSGFFAVAEVESEENMRMQLAMRGMGNLKELSMGREGVRARIENPALSLLVVGLTQGLYERAFDTDSEVEWELLDQGDLEVEVFPR